MATAAQDAFKIGFLTRCAEEGLTGEALETRLALVEKRAAGAAEALAALGIGLPIGVGLVGGGALGHGAAKFTEPQISDEQIKAQELANTYRVYADRLKAKRRMKQYRSV
jgi:hypothetical protein